MALLILNVEGPSGIVRGWVALHDERAPEALHDGRRQLIGVRAGELEYTSPT